MSVGFVSTAIMLVACAFGIFGVSPNLREVAWAVEDSIAWIAERAPLPFLIGALYLVLFGSITLLVTEFAFP